jgi:hypothetical protein
MDLLVRISGDIIELALVVFKLVVK